VNVGTKPKLFCCFSIRNCSKRDFITVPATIYICVQKTAACPTRHFFPLCVCLHYRCGGPLKLNRYINPLNAELNPICHLLVLLGDLTFMGPCIISIFQYTCISNNVQRYTVYLYLETVLHISGGTSTHHQELIQLHLQHLVFVTPLLLSAAIVEELEPV
jgi:hypothetical protein